MSTEIVRKYRKQIPAAHRHSLDTRIAWLWNQKFGTVQMVWTETNDVLDKTAATIVLQAIMGHDINSIELIFQRLEGGAQVDTEVTGDSSLKL